MGKGKGEPEFWCAPVRPGIVLYEVAGVPEEAARQAFRLVAQKMPIRVRFVSRRTTV
jgi:large subunit ribosomal protein L16